ncbi:MAG: hypothetical protein NPIRA05_21190 [Nitrospirales bacterium]|nr:MAG: hypothetical protein NPIRA05_21190 [Nitrospirales bacterium]
MAQEFIAALRAAISPLSAPHLVMFCPPAHGWLTDMTLTSFAHMLQKVEHKIVEETQDIDNLYVVTTSQLQEIYPVREFYDPYADRIAHIPYTDEYFTALGTMALRKIWGLKRPLYKVVVLDCDYTLWRGACGEDGPEHISIEEPYLTVQMFMRAQYEAGMLLCLCSKNHENDVLNVFINRSDMLLNLDQLVGWRINWQPKSENIKSLSEEFNLGLDSFIFLDDNPIECAEVRANCPEVLTIQLPTEVSSIPHALAHMWAFDHMKVTQEDRGRTRQYQQNIKREQARRTAESLENFLETLQLSIHLSLLKQSQVSRVSQLTQRTNQFNLTTRRCTESDIWQWIQIANQHVLVVEVSDRFGDYGLVGSILYRIGVHHLEVESFLLSCRVLGRGVEHRMLQELGRIAIQHGLEAVRLIYRPTTKNEPAFEFIRRMAATTDQILPTHSEILKSGDGEISVLFSARNIQTISSVPVTHDNLKDRKDLKCMPLDQEERINEDKVYPMRDSSDWSSVLAWISEEMSSAEKILQYVMAIKHPRPALEQTYVRARTKTERLLRTIWMEVLDLEDVGLLDSLEELGGSSLHVVQIHSKLQKFLSLAGISTNVPVAMLFQYPTIRKLADFIERGHASSSQSASMAKSRAVSQQSAFFRMREVRKSTTTSRTPSSFR